MAEAAEHAIEEQILKEFSQQMGKDFNEATMKKILPDIIKGITKDITPAVKDETLKAIDTLLKKDTLSAAQKDVLTSIKTNLNKNSTTFLSKVKALATTAGDFAKSNPKLAAAGVTTSAIAIYSAIKGKSFKDGAKDFIDTFAGSLKDTSDLMDDALCKTTGVCLKSWLDKIKAFLKRIVPWIILLAVVGLLWWALKGDSSQAGPAPLTSAQIAQAPVQPQVIYMIPPGYAQPVPQSVGIPQMPQMPQMVSSPSFNTPTISIQK